jgi:cellulose biosynthesis protein BcsQ
MVSKTYCFASVKGGSGKTVLCSSFAAFLADLGKKVLMVDVDVATHGLTLFYLDEVNDHKKRVCEDHGKPNGLFDSESFSSDRDTVHLANKVDLLPATYYFHIQEVIPDTQLRSALSEIVNQAKGNYDYIFLDAQAGADVFARLAMSEEISDEVIIVTEYDPLSAAGVERLKAVMRDELIYVRTWVLLNKMLPDFVETFSDFLEISKYLSPIPWDADVIRAYSRRRLPLDLEYGNHFTLAVMQTLKRLLPPEIVSQMETWAESRASNIRQPIEEQYIDAEKELKGMLEKRLKSYKIATTRRLIRVAAVVTFPAVLIAWVITSGAFEEAFRFSSRVLISLIVFFITMISVIFLYGSKLWEKDAEREFEEARFNRQLIVVEDKLKRLEVLRKADLRTLIKERKGE